MGARGKGGGTIKNKISLLLTVSLVEILEIYSRYTHQGGR